MNYEDALNDANVALHIAPDRSDAYFALAEILVALNKYEEAIRILEVLHNFNPNDEIIKS
jgi:tetratricopeptide (TPR) repeat protein